MANSSKQKHYFVLQDCAFQDASYHCYLFIICGNTFTFDHCLNYPIVEDSFLSGMMSISVWYYHSHLRHITMLTTYWWAFLIAQLTLWIVLSLMLRLRAIEIVKAFFDLFNPFASSLWSLSAIEMQNLRKRENIMREFERLKEAFYLYTT